MRISDWSSDVCSSDLPPIGTFGVSRQAKQGSRQKPPSIIRAACAINRRVWRCSLESFQSFPPSGDECGNTSSKAMSRALAPVAQASATASNRRSEERRVGKGGGSTCRHWWLRNHSKKKQAE